MITWEFGSSLENPSRIPLYAGIGLMQSCILEGFSNELPNTHFRNGGISRNWSKLFMKFLAKCITHYQFNHLN